MSHICFYVLSIPKKQSELQQKLLETSQKEGFGIMYDPRSSLFNTIKASSITEQLVFCVTDGTNGNVATQLLGYESQKADNTYWPLIDRLFILQRIAQLCAAYCDQLSLYISDDNPYLPDYTFYSLECPQIATTILSEYSKKDFDDVFLPCIHISVKGKTDSKMRRKTNY